SEIRATLTSAADSPVEETSTAFDWRNISFASFTSSDSSQCTETRMPPSATLPAKRFASYSGESRALGDPRARQWIELPISVLQRISWSNFRRAEAFPSDAIERNTQSHETNSRIRPETGKQ